MKQKIDYLSKLKVPTRQIYDKMELQRDISEAETKSPTVSYISCRIRSNKSWQGSLPHKNSEDHLPLQGRPYVQKRCILLIVSQLIDGGNFF